MKKNSKIYAWGVDLMTNDLGFRDNRNEIPSKKKDEFRIVVLGDSFTVSAGVEFERIYTSLLKNKIKNVLPEVEIINLAVGGYNIVQYQMVLEEIGLKLSPDMVLVSVFPYNDFEMNAYEENYLIALGQYQQKTLPWYQQLYVYRAYLRRLEVFLEQLLEWGNEQPKNSDEYRQGGWDENIAALDEISRISGKNNIIMAAAVLPNTGGFERQQEIVRKLKEHCEKRGIFVVDLYEPFISLGSKGSDLRLNLLDEHPNEKYNALVADVLYPHLVKLIAE